MNTFVNDPEHSVCFNYFFSFLHLYYYQNKQKLPKSVTNKVEAWKSNIILQKMVNSSSKQSLWATFALSNKVQKKKFGSHQWTDWWKSHSHPKSVFVCSTYILRALGLVVPSCQTYTEGLWSILGKWYFKWNISMYFLLILRCRGS